MLAYQSTSFHDALYIREALGKRPAPEFEIWLEKVGLFHDNRRLSPDATGSRLLTRMSGLFQGTG